MMKSLLALLAEVGDIGAKAECCSMALTPTKDNK